MASAESVARPNRRAIRSRARGRGLTLIELVIGLAVLALLGTLALPSFSGRVAHHRLQAAAQTLAADIAEARFEAARRGQPLHLQASGGAQWCWSLALQPGCPCGSAQSCQIRTVGAADHRGVLLAPGAVLRLDPDGSVTHPGEAATLTSARGERLQVQVSALGRARVCALSGQWPQLPAC